MTERYHINGRPITEKYFSKVFWKLYNTLDKYKEHAADLPTYFKFLTILGLHIFFDSNVDVAIIETGVGGLYDSTNIVRYVIFAKLACFVELPSLQQCTNYWHNIDWIRP